MHRPLYCRVGDACLGAYYLSNSRRSVHWILEMKVECIIINMFEIRKENEDKEEVNNVKVEK